MLQSKSANLKKQTAIYLGLIITLGLILRLYYTPYDLPIVTDGFFSFIYAAETVFQSNLPIGYTTTNTGWANFLSLIFSFTDVSEPIRLMEIQRITSIVFSTITIIPAFFIFRRFVKNSIALYADIITNYENNSLEIMHIPNCDSKQGEYKFFINGEETDKYTIKMDNGYYWMIGDNRHNSQDSRCWGYVPFSHVVGKPLLVWLSIDIAWLLLVGRRRHLVFGVWPSTSPGFGGLHVALTWMF